MQLIAAKEQALRGGEPESERRSYTAPDMGAYFSTIGRRLLRWGITAVVTIGFYALGSLVGLPAALLLVVAFIGAIAGSVLGLRVIERLLGPEPQPAPPPPRGRGSGRRGA